MADKKAVNLTPIANVATGDIAVVHDLTDTAELRGATFQQISDLFKSLVRTLTNHTISADDNSIVQGTPAAGQYLRDNGTKFVGSAIVAADITDFNAEVSNNAAVVANTAKVSNATHTGEVTGSTSLTVDKSAITGKTAKASPTSGDFLLVTDGADSDTLKKVDVANLPTGGGGEANLGSNVGTAGVGVFKDKSGVTLRFKKINAGSSKVTITDDTGNDEVDVDVAEGNIKLDDLGTPDDNTDLDATASLHGLMSKADKSKLDSIESGATADQGDSEIETAYNNQVDVVTQAEAEDGTDTNVHRWTPQRVKQAIDSLGGGGGGSGTAPTIVEKQSNQTVNNSVTLVNDTALFFAMAASRRYYWVLRFRFDADSTPDIKITFTVPSGAEGQHRRDLDNNTELNYGATGSLTGSTGNPRQGFSTGWVKTGGTVGNLQFQWAQNTADASDTIVKEGSVLLVYDLGAA